MAAKRARTSVVRMPNRSEETSGVSQGFTLRAATEADFEPLLALSIRAMRADLERIGRFDPDRRRARMRAGFDPSVLRVIESDGAIVGCIAVAPAPDHVEIHSFYLDPPVQGRGLGTSVLRAVMAPYGGLPWRIEVVKQSPALEFWKRQGFRAVAEQEFDWACERPPSLGATAPRG